MSIAAAGAAERHEIVVIGAGLSGLAFARQVASSGRPVLVLEAAAAPGGCIHTERLPEGFWLELGAHTLYNSYGRLLAAIEALGLGGKITPRGKAPYRMLVDGRLRSVASQLRFGEAVASAWRVVSEKKRGRTVADYYGRVAGRGNFERVLAPLFAAVPSQRADDFPADLLFKSRKRRKDVPRSFTMEGGLGSLIDALAHAPGVTVRTAAAARAIERVERRFSIATEGGRSIEARLVALALPPGASARLLESAAPEIARLLGRVGSAEIDSVGVVVRTEDATLPRLSGIVARDDAFFSAVTRDVVPDSRLRAFTFHFRPGLPLDRRLQRIADVVGVARDRFVHVATHATSLPSPALGHADIVRGIDAALPGSGLFLVGNYFGGLAIEDCAIRAAAEGDRLLAEAAGGPPGSMGS